MAVHEARSRAQRTIIVIEPLDLELKRIALNAGVNKSKLYELGARILLVILQHGRVPDDLGYLLENHDQEALRQLQVLLSSTNRRVTV